MPLVFPHASVVLDARVGEAAFEFDVGAFVAVVHVGEDPFLHRVADYGCSEGEFFGVGWGDGGAGFGVLVVASLFCRGFGYLRLWTVGGGGCHAGKL